MKLLIIKEFKIKKVKSKFLFYFWVVSTSFLALNLNYALALGDAYFPQDTTANLTIDGTSTNFTILAESDANQVTINASSITVNISSGQSFKLRSYGGLKLTNDASISYSCSGGESELNVTVSSTKDVVISPDSTACSAGGGGGGGGAGGVGSSSAASTAVATPASTPVSSPVSSVPTTGSTPVARGFVSLTALSLKEGDVMSATGSDDPDVYIVNSWGYKRLFLNPVIFGFYGHLGGFSKVKKATSTTRDTLVTSGLFRNCETNDPKVYGVEVTGEDMGTLHWVNTTGAQAVADDSDFFKKVFCINNNEFSWYKKGANYTSVKQIPEYNRKTVSSSPVPSPTAVISKGKIKVISSIGWLNVRDSGSTNGKIVAKVLSGEEYVYVEFKGGWYKIQKDGKDFGWVLGDYVFKL